MATAPTAHPHNFPKIHNAGWPGVVGKGGDSEPPIALDDMLRYTSEAEVDGLRFDGIDLFLFDPHVSIESSDDDLKALRIQVLHGGALDRLDGHPPDMLAVRVEIVVRQSEDHLVGQHVPRRG